MEQGSPVSLQGGFWNIYGVMFEEVGTRRCRFLTLPLRMVRRPRVSGRGELRGPWQGQRLKRLDLSLDLSLSLQHIFQNLSPVKSSQILKSQVQVKSSLPLISDLPV